MAQEKTIKTTGYVSQPKSQSGEINVNELAIMNIDNVLETIMGANGES